MPSDDADGFEPALDSTTTEEASVEAEPVVRRDSPGAQAQAAAKIGTPPGEDDVTGPEPGPRSPRVWNPASRALFRQVVKQVQAGEVDTAGDLEPMVHTPPPAAAAPAAAPPAVPVAAPVAPPAAPVVPPPGLPPLPDLPLPALPQAAAQPAAPDPKHAEREAAIAAREAALAEREKLMPDRTGIAERPVETFLNWMRDVHGITDDADMKVALTDFVTEASERGLGVKLPDEVKAAMESRKALRSVKAYKADLTREQQKLADQRVAAEKQAADARSAAEAQQRDAAYVNRIAELIAPAAAQHKFLHDPKVTEGLAPQVIVYEVMKEQQRIKDAWEKNNPGQQAPSELRPNLNTATEYANSYYKAKAEAAAQSAAYFQSLLAPAAAAPAVAPATTAASPGGVPGPTPKPTPTPAPTVEWDPADLPMDRQQRRAHSLALLRARQKQANGA